MPCSPPSRFSPDAPSGSAASPAVSAASEEAGGIPAEPHVPVYTYENPDPDMVLVQSEDGDITYKDYRLYLDVNEELARYSARQSPCARRGGGAGSA